MKSKTYFIIILLMIIAILNISYMPIVKAADEYSFELNYTGDIVINEEKEGNVILRGTNGTPYPRVRIKVDIEGPAKPKVLATDSSGVEHDIVDLGYWGPDAGFAVGGTFENNTPIRATFTAAGTYTITLSLVNLDSNENKIVSTVTTIEVLEDESNVENDVNSISNTIIDPTNNTIEELPQTGTSVAEYVIYTVIIIAVVIFGYYKIRKV